MGENEREKRGKEREKEREREKEWWEIMCIREKRNVGKFESVEEREIDGVGWRGKEKDRENEREKRERKRRESLHYGLSNNYVLCLLKLN
jgi:hypothetical protein